MGVLEELGNVFESNVGKHQSELLSKVHSKGGNR